MNKEEFLKAIMEHSKTETINPISTINSIDVDDLMSAIDRLNKVPTYDELLKENKKQKEIINKIEEKIKENIENAKYEITRLTITDREYYKYMDDMLNDLLQILKDKEV